MKKKILIICISVVIIAIAVILFFIMNQSKNNIAKTSTSDEISVSDLNTTIDDMETKENEATLEEVSEDNQENIDENTNESEQDLQEETQSLEKNTNENSSNRAYAQKAKKTDEKSAIQTTEQKTSNNNTYKVAGQVTTSQNQTTQTEIESLEAKDTSTVDGNNETVKEQEPTRCISNNNHGMAVGNSEKWFDTKNDAIEYYNSKIRYWGDLWESYQIDNETYYKNCPSGYEVWSCMYCSKWTINFYYR